MTFGIPSQFQAYPPQWQPTIPLPPIPIAVRPSASLTPSQSQLSLHQRSNQCSVNVANLLERESPLQQIISRSGSIDTAATSVGSGGKRKGPPEVQWDASKDRKYARLYSLSDADISDLPIIMRNETLKFEKRIAQEKSSDSLGARPHELRPNPKEPKQMFERMKQSYISKKFLEGRSRGNVAKQPKSSYPTEDVASTEFETLESQLDKEISAGTFGSSRTSSYQFLEALENFAQDIPKDAGQRSVEANLERRIRTSYESLQSLRRRINERKVKKGQKLREYSDEELVKYIFIKRLSVGSLPSDRSTTSSLLSKRTSDASDASSSRRRSSSTASSIRNYEFSESHQVSTAPVFTGNYVDNKDTPSVQPLRHIFEARRPKPGLSIKISRPAIQSTTNMAFSPTLGFDTTQPQEKLNAQMEAAAVSKQKTPSASLNADNADSMIWVEGFPHVGPHFPNLNLPIAISQTKVRNYPRPASLTRFIQTDVAPTTPNQPPRQMCCVNRCRGDPRADKCLFCLFDIPEAHFFVRSLVEQWRAGRDLTSTFAARPVAIDFGEVDDFGDTVLHLAASLGAGSVILPWLISLGVNAHAKNAAGQTFMHVLDTRGFWHWPESDFSPPVTGEGDMVFLLNFLQGMNFDFNARDDYGQTPMHVLAQNWLPVHIIQTTFVAGMVGASILLNKDFRGRSVESLIQAQGSVHHHTFLSPQREMAFDSLLYLTKPIVAVPPQKKHQLPLPDQTPQEATHPHAGLRKTINKTTSGFPDTKYRGRNGLHCLAESCISLRLESSDRDTAAIQLKRKRQAGTTLRHEYIINTVKTLLEVGVDPNDYDDRGNTPIMAFTRNRLSPNFERKITAEVLQILIDGGASVHRRNRKGQTALHIAMLLGRPSAVEVLLNNYANVHSRAKDGEGILAAACKASLRAKQDGALYHRIITCIAIAAKYGAILGPSTKDEWDRQSACVNKEGSVMIESPRKDNEGINNKHPKMYCRD